MSGAPSSRRGFLSGLSTLPLIGGGVTLIGAPTAVAEPISRRLMREYETWLGIEHARIADELRPGAGLGEYALYGPAYQWHRTAYRDEAPSTRAALILSAVGCDWGRS